MDAEAFAKCRAHSLPVMVINFRKEGLLERAVRGEHVGTIIHI